MFAFAAQTTSAAPAPAPTGYVSQGCYTDNTGGRALIGAAFFDDSMTVGKCAAVCDGWELFGVEYVLLSVLLALIIPQETFTDIIEQVRKRMLLW